jgi:GntP family gluconate:H+ symporter
MNQQFLLIILALMISVASIVLLSRYLNLHAFFCLIIASLLLGTLTGKSVSEIIVVMQTGFGSLLQQIGFIVALGSCMGIVLEKTGAMESISERLVYFFGQRRSPFALTTIGLLVGIPVFCDSGFIILSRLIPSIAASASLSPATLSLTLSSALYTTHTLVPPTPGPLAAAANLGLGEHLGQVILINILASIPVGLVALAFSKKMGSKISSTEKHIQIVERSSVSPTKAVLPLVVPIILIGLATLPRSLNMTGLVSTLLTVAGQPFVALFIGLMLAFLLIKPSQKKEWPHWLSEALKDAGVILLITGAGGAFGSVIKNVGMDIHLKNFIVSNEAQGVVFLLFAFFIAAVLKSSQGSTTSSLIVTTSIIAPLAISAGFETPVQLCSLLIAVGGGGMTVSHANDSYFWVVSQFGGIAAKDMFRSYTLITLIQGITALVVAILLFLVW